MKKPFLKAEWRKLAMANYAVDEAVLRKYLPFKTEMDRWNDVCYLSLVGFMFLNTRIKGIPVPFHINFEEVNLRFYVRHQDGGLAKRGVVFIKEIVSRPALTMVANALYKENYETMPTKHTWKARESLLEVEYGWKKGNWNSFRVTAQQNSVDLQTSSEAEFISEHFLGLYPD